MYAIKKPVGKYTTFGYPADDEESVTSAFSTVPHNSHQASSSTLGAGNSLLRQPVFLRTDTRRTDLERAVTFHDPFGLKKPVSS